MSEPLVRLGLVLVVLVTAIVVSAWFRRRARPSVGPAHPTSLSPGVYLFSSRDCLDCLAARLEIEKLLAGKPFFEVGWEESPSTFRDLGVDVVPTTVIVARDGSAVLHPGVPSSVINPVDP